MIEHQWSILCSKCIVDNRTNNATLVEILEQLTILIPNDGSGLVVREMDLVTLWSRETEEEEQGRARLTLLDPKGSPVGDPILFSLDLSVNQRLRSVTSLQSIPFNGVGRYTFRTEIERGTQWELASEVHLSILR
jgi:hypothetical protein